MSNNPSPTLADRIQKALTRLRCNNCVLQRIHDGQVPLFCPKIDRNDHGKIQAATCLLPGFLSVLLVAQPQQKDKS